MIHERLRDDLKAARELKKEGDKLFKKLMDVRSKLFRFYSKCGDGLSFEIADPIFRGLRRKATDTYGDTYAMETLIDLFDSIKDRIKESSHLDRELKIKLLTSVKACEAALNDGYVGVLSKQ